MACKTCDYFDWKDKDGVNSSLRKCISRGWYCHPDEGYGFSCHSDFEKTPRSISQKKEHDESTPTITKKKEHDESTPTNNLTSPSYNNNWFDSFILKILAAIAITAIILVGIAYIVDFFSNIEMNIFNNSTDGTTSDGVFSKIFTFIFGMLALTGFFGVIAKCVMGIIVGAILSAILSNFFESAKFGAIVGASGGIIAGIAIGSISYAIIVVGAGAIIGAIAGAIVDKVVGIYVKEGAFFGAIVGAIVGIFIGIIKW